MPTGPHAMLRAENVHRRFPAPRAGRSPDAVVALDDVSFSIDPGEFVIVQGASGSGKSTLLLTLGGMQRPSAGRILLENQDLYARPADERNRARAHRLGFVFQLFHLVPYLSVRENVLAGFPRGPGPSAAERFRRTDDLLERLGLGERTAHRPATLSAGERQRVALARALVKQPAVILADEPTGNLDPANAAEVFRQLESFHRAGGTVVVVTHGHDAAPYANRTLHLDRGRLLAPP